jgi:hypothetical protein
MASHLTAARRVTSARPSDLAYVRHDVARIGSHLASHTISARKGYSEDVSASAANTWSHMEVWRVEVANSYMKVYI